MLLALPVHIDGPAFDTMIGIVKKSFKLAGLSDKEACGHMLISQSQWDAQCDGTGHVSWTRLALLPAHVKAWIGALLLLEYGLPKEFTTLMELCGIAVPKPEPVKMQPDALQEKRSA